MQKPLLFIFIIVVAFSCKQSSSTKSTNQDQQKSKASNSEETWATISGRTMGTVYNIKYDTRGLTIKNLKKIVDSTLVSINNAVSTYEPTSIISKFNDSGTNELSFSGSDLVARHFTINYLSSKLIYSDTEGAFDPTVMPLVNFWGFGYTEKKAVEKVDSQKVSKILELVGMDKISHSKQMANTSGKNFRMTKLAKGISLDFSAIAKGYAVDELAKLLNKLTIKTYMIEIGGEVKVATDEKSSKVWKIGINEPLKDAPINSLNSIVNPKNNAMATSGNYRNYYETKELSYGHEINPMTGYPIQTDIFSASVISESCKMADAYATAFMIMGLEKSLTLVNSRPDLEACFITIEAGEMVNVYSEGFEKYLVD